MAKAVPYELRKQLRDVQLYDTFDNPYTALAAMIVVQAIDDLKHFKGRDVIVLNGEQITKYEVVKFLKSKWAEEIIVLFGIERDVLLRAVNEIG